MKLANYLLGLLFLFNSFTCGNSFFRKFANPIKWVPRYGHDLTSHDKLLSSKVPITLSSHFDTKWNLANKPPRDGHETYIVAEDIIEFLVKDIAVSGGSGKLFFRKKDGTMGKEFTPGTKIQKGDTPLYYVPTSGDRCAGHTITIKSVLLTLDFAREAGAPKPCSLFLDAPTFEATFKQENAIFYVEDEKAPIDLVIDSRNDIAAKQSYKLVRFEVSGGRGRLYDSTIGQEVFTGLTLQFGANKLHYKADEIGSGEHNLKVLLSSIETGKEYSLQYPIKVEDHRVQDFKAAISPVRPNERLLPFRQSEWLLTITPTEETDQELSYSVKSFDIHAGSLLYGEAVIKEGTAFSGLKNTLVLDPKGHVGELGITMTIVNSKGDERPVSFTAKPEINNPDFKIESNINQEVIALTLTAPHHHHKDQWMLLDYTVSKGLKGILVDPNGSPIPSNTPLQLGTNYFSFKVADLTTLRDFPSLSLRIRHPDGDIVSTVGIDLSYFVLKQINPDIETIKHSATALYASMVDTIIINPEAAIHSREIAHTTWLSGLHRSRNILAHLKKGLCKTVVDREIAALDSLEKDCHDQLNNRMHITRKLYALHKTLSTVHERNIEERYRVYIGMRRDLTNIRRDYGNALGSYLADLAPTLRNLEALTKEEGFTAVFSPSEEHASMLPFKQAQWKLNIEPLNTLNTDLKYYVKSFSIAHGSMLFGGSTLTNHVELRAMEDNSFLIDPEGYTGDLGIEMKLVNSRGDECMVTFSRRPEAQNVVFKVHTRTEKDGIELMMESSHAHINDQWGLVRYTISKGIKGLLVDSNGNDIRENTPLPLGKSLFSFKVENLFTLRDLPKLTLHIRQPDGSVVLSEDVDLSYFVCKHLLPDVETIKKESSKLYAALVNDYRVNPAAQIIARIQNYDKWLNVVHNVSKVFYSIKQGICRQDAANMVTMLEKLEKDIYHQMHRRIELTKQLHKFYNVVNKINVCNIEGRLALFQMMRFNVSTLRKEFSNDINTYLSDVSPVLKYLEDFSKEADFTVIFSPSDPSVPFLSFKQNRWELRIQPKNHACVDLKYYVKSLNMDHGKLIINNKPLTVGTELGMHNVILIDPENHIGDLGIAMTVISSKGDERKLTLQGSPSAQRIDFKVHTGIRDNRIQLKLEPSDALLDGKWTLLDYTLSKRLKGKLIDLEGHEVRKGTVIQPGISYLSFEVNGIPSTKELPSLVLYIRKPDGSVHITEKIDLSVFALSKFFPDLEKIRNESSYFYQSFVEDYEKDPFESIYTFEEKYKTWINNTDKVIATISCMRNGSEQLHIDGALAELHELKNKTAERHLKRMQSTRMVYEWYKEILHGIHNNQDPKERSLRIVELRNSITSFRTEITNEDGRFDYLADLVQKCDDMLGKIVTEDTETNRLAEKIRIEKERIDNALVDLGLDISRLEKQTSGIKSMINANNQLFELKIKEVNDSIEALRKDIKNLNSKASRLTGDIEWMQKSSEESINDLIFKIGKLNKRVHSLVEDVYGVNDRVNNNTEWWSSNKTGSLNTEKKRKK